jgi:hypothetical protein
LVGQNQKSAAAAADKISIEIQEKNSLRLDKISRLSYYLPIYTS